MRKPVSEAAPAVENPTLFITEAFASAGTVADKIDREKGIVKDVVLFAPQRRGDIYESKNGNFYAPSFFDSAKTVLEGAPCYDGHPDQNPNGIGLKNRKVSESIGRIRNVRMMGEKLVGDLHFIKDCAESFINRVESMWDTIGMSVAARAKYVMEAGREVMTGFDLAAKRRPSIDLVDQPGAATNLFESLNQESKETPEMTPEEIQAKIDAAVAQGRKDILESLKTELAQAKATQGELVTLKRQQLVSEKLTGASLTGENSKYVTESLRMTLATCDEAKMDDIIKNHKETIGGLLNPVNGMGGQFQTGQTKTITETVSVEMGRVGTKNICESLADGKTGSDRPQRIAARWMTEVAPAYRQVFGKRDNAAIAKTNEFMANISVKDIYEACFGKRAEWGMVKDFFEAAIASSSYSIITGDLLGTKVIEGYNTTEGLVGSRLVTPYNSRLIADIFPGFNAPAGIADVAEGAKYPDATIAEKGVGDTTFSKRGAMVLITEETILFDQTASILMRANQVGQFLAVDQEKSRVYGVTDQTSYKSYYPLVTGTPTQTNLYVGAQEIESNPLADYTSLNALKLELGQQVDSNSDPIMGNAMGPFEILIPLALDTTADRVINSTETEYRNNSAAVIGRGPNPYSGTVKIMSPLLDSKSTTTWYGSGAGGWRKQFIEKIHFPFQVVPVPPAEADNVSKDIVGGIRARYKTKVFALDRVYVVKCYSSASP